MYNRIPFVVSSIALALAAVACSFALWKLPSGATATAVFLILVLLLLAILTAGLHRLNKGSIEADQFRHLETARGELAERRLLALREMIDELADGLETAVFVLDAKGNIEYANRKACELFNFDEPLGRSILAVSLSHILERIVLDAGGQGVPQNAEIKFGIGGERVALARAWPEIGESSRVFLSIYDITGLRHLERVRQDFVANVSHELRTPMATVRAMAETLSDLSAPDPKLEKRYLGKIIDEIDRLTSIVDDLLLLSAAESTDLAQGTSDVGILTSEICKQLEPKARVKSITLDLKIEPKVLVQMPSSRMTQVILNLIDNAIKYSNDGTITVEVKAEEPLAYFAVTDSGIGIASDHLPRVFERFYRVDKGRSRASGGTGLGLSIVKHLVESYGGNVVVASALNRGSTFTVSLPMATEEQRSEDFPDPIG